VVLPASGCEMIANVFLRLTSFVKLSMVCNPCLANGRPSTDAMSVIVLFESNDPSG